MTEEVTIETLVKDFIGGSKEAGTQIVSRSYGGVYNLCYSILSDKNEAEDAAQETFLKMFKNIAQYDTNRGFIPWLFQIAVNTSRNMLSKKRPRSFLEPEQTLTISDIKFSPADIITKEENLSQITAAMERLSPELKIVMWLKYQQGLENDEIAQILEISPGALRVRLFRAINIIREKVRKED